MLHLGCLISRTTREPCVMLENTQKKRKEEAAEARHAAGLFFFFFSMQENTMKDINRAAMSHVSRICKDAVNAPHPVSC